MDDKLRSRLERAAEITLEEARNIASRFSRRIPLATRLVSDRKGVRIEVSDAAAPNARPMEFGIRHPLNFPNQQRNGERHWARTPFRPFLAEARDNTADRVAEEVIQWADDMWNEV